jgi:hypothetical protein
LSKLDLSIILINLSFDCVNLCSILFLLPLEFLLLSLLDNLLRDLLGLLALLAFIFGAALLLGSLFLFFPLALFLFSGLLLGLFFEPDTFLFGGLGLGGCFFLLDLFLSFFLCFLALFFGRANNYWRLGRLWRRFQFFKLFFKRSLLLTELSYFFVEKIFFFLKQGSHVFVGF